MLAELRRIIAVSLLPSYPKRCARFDNFNVVAAAVFYFIFFLLLYDRLFCLFIFIYFYSFFFALSSSHLALACCKNINPVVLISSHFQLERECEYLRCLHLLLLCTIIARPTTAENTYKFTFISHSVTFYSSCGCSLFCLRSFISDCVVIFLGTHTINTLNAQ